MSAGQADPALPQCQRGLYFAGTLDAPKNQVSTPGVPRIGIDARLTAGL